MPKRVLVVRLRKERVRDTSLAVSFSFRGVSLIFHFRFASNVGEVSVGVAGSESSSKVLRLRGVGSGFIAGALLLLVST